MNKQQRNVYEELYQENPEHAENLRKFWELTGITTADTDLLYLTFEVEACDQIRVYLSFYQVKAQLGLLNQWESAHWEKIARLSEAGMSEALIYLLIDHLGSPLDFTFYRKIEESGSISEHIRIAFAHLDQAWQFPIERVLRNTITLADIPELMEVFSKEELMTIIRAHTMHE